MGTAQLFAQCPNNNVLTFAAPQNMTPSGVGNTVINSQIWAGEYVTVNVTTGYNYTFSLCTNNSYDTYMTIYQEPSGTLIGFNNDFCTTRSQITWTSTFNGTIRVLMDQGAACGSNAVNTELRVTLNSIFAVEWLSFNATPSPRGVDLNWETATESNSDRFVIERSQDGHAFAPIGNLEAAHNSQTAKAYHFEDHSPASGTNYYRIKELTMDGSAGSISSVVEVTLPTQPGLSIVGLYPNPAASRTTLQLQSDSQAPYHISLMDITGRQIRTWDFPSQIGLFDQTLALEGLEIGTYLLQVSHNGQQLHKKLLIGAQ